MKRLSVLFSFLLFLLPAWAQVRVTVQAPSDVVEGDRFRVSYVVNTQDVDNFNVDKWEGLVELFGPSQSRSSSFSMVNAPASTASIMPWSSLTGMKAPESPPT